MISNWVLPGQSWVTGNSSMEDNCSLVYAEGLASLCASGGVGTVHCWFFKKLNCFEGGREEWFGSVVGNRDGTHSVDHCRPTVDQITVFDGSSSLALHRCLLADFSSKHTGECGAGT